MKDLILRARQGDGDAMAEIVSQYKGLIRSVANNFYLVGGDKDDLLQEGMLGLFNAVNNYDGNKGSFPSFVKLCVYRQIVNAVRSSNNDKNKALASSVELSALNDTADGLDNPLDVLLKKEYAEKIQQVIDLELTKTERQVLRLFADGYTYEDITAATGKSFKAVDGALQRARKKLLAQKE